MSLFSTESTVIYTDGHLRKLSDVRVSPWDQGFLYGASLFATFPVEWDGTVPFWESHRQRLLTNCQSLGITPPPTFFLHNSLISRKQILAELLRRNHLSQGRVVSRYRISAGECGPGLPASASYPGPREFLDLRIAPSVAPDTPATLHCLKTVREHGEITSRMKSGAYLNSLVAHREGFLQGLRFPDEGLLLDSRGNVSEGVTSNVFWINRGVLHTPGPETGCYPGTVREWILEYARINDVPFEEGGFPLDSILQAEAVFLTNATRGLFPMDKLLHGSTEICLPNAHPLFRSLRRAWLKAREQSLTSAK